MAKPKNIKQTSGVSKVFVSTIILVVLAVFLWMNFSSFVMTSDYFKVKVVMIDPSLQFIDKRELAGIKGRNIFKINIVDLQRKLSFRYPQVADIKVVRHFPDQIWVVARKRSPVVQTSLGNRTVTLDDKGIVLSSNDKLNGRLPLLKGIRMSKRGSVLGLPLTDDLNLQVALEVLHKYRLSSSRKFFTLNEIDVDNLSKINLYLSNNLKIILDGERVEQKMRTLDVVLSQAQLNLSEVNYIDLRFHDPIIGKK